MELRARLNGLYTEAARAESPEALGLVDAVRDALDYFPGDEEKLLKKCGAVVGAAKKRDWGIPVPAKYQGDPLKAYTDALRAGKDSAYLANEVLKKVGLDSLGDVWLHLGSEDPGDHGGAFVVGSVCRRALLYMDPAKLEPLLFWASRFFSEHAPKKKVEVSGVPDYYELEDDLELMKRISVRPGEHCENIVLYHRIKQNMNHLGRAHSGHLIRYMKDVLDKEKEATVVLPERGDETGEDLAKALAKKELVKAAAAINTLVNDDMDTVCKALLEKALSVGGPKEAKPFFVMYSACELSRTMRDGAALPLIQATAYMFKF